VTSPRDEIDEWLEGGVTPLNPPPGSLDRIRRRARQRKTTQAMFTAAGCAVLLAAAVSVPQLLAAGHPSARSTAPAIGSIASSAGTTPGRSTSQSPGQALGKGTQLSQRTHLSTTTSGTVPPRHFRPTSVTIVGTGTGGLVGAVIGQAGPPCATKDCTSLAGTSTYGASWYGVSAPVAPGPDGSTGLSQLRFTNLLDGWAFGPGLYETSGGGWPWVKESTYGQRVIDVEAAGDSALAIFATCSGTGPDYAADCTNFALYSSVAGSSSWTPVTVPAGYLSTGQASSASLVISDGTTGYLLTPSGAVLRGPVSGGTWTLAGQAPCKPGAAQLSGAPASAQLAASPSQLLLACDGSTDRTVLYTSANGAHWQSVSVVPATAPATSLASAAAGQVVLATGTGIYYSATGGTTWAAASFGDSGAPADGFSYVGMTTASQGVAVPADSALGEIFVTSDGGRTWTASPITG